MRIAILSILPGLLMFSSLLHAQIPKRQTPRSITFTQDQDGQGIRISTGGLFYGLTTLSLGSLIGLTALKAFQESTDLLGINYAQIKDSAHRYSARLHRIDPGISTAESSVWTGIHVLSRTPTTLIPTFIAFTISFGLGYLAARLIKSGYRSLTGSSSKS